MQLRLWEPDEGYYNFGYYSLMNGGHTSRRKVFHRNEDVAHSTTFNGEVI
jgi:hypothetical protein